ncbi:hypothetical protein [Ralstonia solanacearum]|uniref:hypothetical protein n=1 Tax=Ralstonia solanacearum TaxID=305 RepID=UPI0013C339A2|nr:hypothetical protein [Ralstonia solanacearum]
MDVQILISLQGQYATAALATAWQASINQLWNQQSWDVGECRVKFTASVDAGGKASNQITVGSPGVKGRSFVLGVGGNSGTWYADAGNWTPAHETGHLMGLGDRYTDVGGVSVPNPGWKGNVMGDFGGIAELRNVQEILKRNMGTWDHGTVSSVAALFEHVDVSRTNSVLGELQSGPSAVRRLCPC